MGANYIFGTDGKVSCEDRCRRLKQSGKVFWFTGLSGAGKSTIAIEVEQALFNKGYLAYRLDGDDIRRGLNRDLGFCELDRHENIRRIAETAKLMSNAGIVTLVSAISPLALMRESARSIIGNERFFEIYVKADLEDCKNRDPKGLYKKVESGEIKEFTGISAPYEESKKPDLVIDTSKLTLGECAEAVISFIEEKIRL